MIITFAISRLSREMKRAMKDEPRPFPNYILSSLKITWDLLFERSMVQIKKRSSLFESLVVNNPQLKVYKHVSPLQSTWSGFVPKSLSGIYGCASCTSGWLRKSHQEAETKYGRGEVYVKESMYMYKQMYKGKRKSQPEAEQEALKA